MAERSVEDRLREEYFDLLPDIRRVTDHLEAEVRYHILPILKRLEKYEQLIVTSRVKACDSAVDALRRRQEGSTFDVELPDGYSLTDLNDLAGVRVLAFPRIRLSQANEALLNRFATWTADPVLSEEVSDPLAFKYHGYCDASSNVKGEFQVVSMLVGLFWQVEHSAVYKPTSRLKGIVGSPEMQERVNAVHSALGAFEATLEELIGSA